MINMIIYHHSTLFKGGAFDLMKKVGMRGEDDDYRKGLWTVEEDRLLSDYIQLHGKGKWSKIPLATGK